MKICTVIGARPQFIKAAALSSVMASNNAFEEVIIHTGQHYDPEMSEIFFKELKIPKEKYNLAIGSGSHGAQTGRMLEEIEKVLLAEKPDWVLIYGDTNSTAAGALAAVKLHIPVAHVEAGMRSFNRTMPEEINRIIADHISTLNFCSCSPAVKNLAAEGLESTAVQVGDVMYDIALKSVEAARKLTDPFAQYFLKKRDYILMTCHRAENTDSQERMSAIVSAVNTIAARDIIALPLHPRTKKFLSQYNLTLHENVKILPPLSYMQMALLEESARLILTDSGGVQKEAFFYDVPCVTMRDETEWIETVESGWNTLTGANSRKIISTVKNYIKHPPRKTDRKPYGDGRASEKILKAILDFSKKASEKI